MDNVTIDNMEAAAKQNAEINRTTSGINMATYGGFTSQCGRFVVRAVPVNTWTRSGSPRSHHRMEYNIDGVRVSKAAFAASL